MRDAWYLRQPGDDPGLTGDVLLAWRKLANRSPERAVGNLAAETIRASSGTTGDGKALSQSETLILACVAYYQPGTRAELSSFFGKEISRDVISHLRGAKLIASGPRSPTPDAPYTCVTTKDFLLEFGPDTLRDLPDFEAGGRGALIEGKAAGWGYSDRVGERGGRRRRRGRGQCR